MNSPWNEDGHGHAGWESKMSDLNWPRRLTSHWGPSYETFQMMKKSPKKKWYVELLTRTIRWMGWPPKPWQLRQEDNEEFWLLQTQKLDRKQHENHSTSLRHCISWRLSLLDIFTGARSTPECFLSAASAKDHLLRHYRVPSSSVQIFGDAELSWSWAEERLRSATWNLGR